MNTKLPAPSLAADILFDWMTDKRGQMKAALIALALLATPAGADTLYFTFTGTVTAADDTTINLFNGAAVTGAPYSLYFSVNPNNSTSTSVGILQGTSLGEAELVIGGYGAIIGSPGSNQVVAIIGNDQAGHFKWDNDQPLGAEVSQFFGPSINTGYFLVGHVLDFGFSTVARVDFFETQFARLFDPPDLSGVQIVSYVPEPPTWALLLIGFAFFGIKGIWPRSSHGK